jgi:hypothetical protein
MWDSCQYGEDCGHELCHGISCSEYKEKRDKTKSHELYDELMRKINDSKEVRDLFYSEPKIHLLYHKLYELGDDERFIIDFIISLVREQIKILDILFKLSEYTSLPEIKNQLFDLSTHVVTSFKPGKA